MENLYIKATKNTPEINLNFNESLLEFKGKSFSENTFEFYKPVEDWIDRFLEEGSNKKISINFDLNYLNSSSIKYYFDLFEKMEEEVVNNNKYIEVIWLYHEDDDMTMETGEEFKEDYENLNIILTQKK